MRVCEERRPFADDANTLMNSSLALYENVNILASESRINRLNRHYSPRTASSTFKSKPETKKKTMNKQTPSAPDKVLPPTLWWQNTTYILALIAEQSTRRVKRHNESHGSAGGLGVLGKRYAKGWMESGAATCKG